MLMEKAKQWYKMTFCNLKYNLTMFSNQIPMEIESEEAEKQKYIINEYLVEQINYNLNVLCKNINNKFLMRKLYSFIQIKKLSDDKLYNLIKAEIYFLQLSVLLKSLLRLYRRLKKKRLNIYFGRWKYNYSSHKKIASLKQQIEISLEKQNLEEINKLHQKLADIEKESASLNKNLTNLRTFEGELLKTIKNFEEKETNLLDKIKTLETKNTKNQEILNTKLQKTSSSYEYVALESKIKLLESQIASMEEENRDRNATINAFLKEMNEMLQVHEQKRKK